MGYKKQLHRFDTSKINNLALYIFLLSFLCAMAINFFAVKAPLLITTKVYLDIILVVAIFIVGLICHEGLHALSAIIFGKCSVKQIKFGINIKQGMLYCHIDKPIHAKSYKIMLIIPVIVTGFALIIVTLFGNIFLIVVFCMLLCGGAGDIIMLLRLQKLDKETLILDHPTAPAFYTLYEEGKQPNNFNEVTAEQEEQLIKDMNTNPKSIYNGKKNVLLINLAILLFLSLAVLVVFVIGFVISFL